MKRMLSIITTVALLFAFLAVPASAEVNAAYDLKQVIEIAKEKLELDTEGFEFNSNYSENYSNNRSVWELYWYSKSGNGESISVVIDASTAEILTYSNWGSFQPYSKIPKYKRDEALKAAEEFLNKICPEKFTEVKLEENPYDRVTLIYNDYYNFNYVRVVNGLEFDANNLSISIDKNTLEVKSFYTSWDNEIFPAIESILSLEKVKNIFAEKQGLKLTYQLVYPDNDSTKPVAMLVYTLNGNYPIDAVTGELLQNSYHYPLLYDKSKEELAVDNAVVITEQEQQEIYDASKYISKDAAIEAIRAYVPEVEKYVLSAANLYSGYGTENANWHLSWILSDEKTKEYSYVSGAVDAVTGEIKSFYRSNDNIYNPDIKDPRYTEEQGKEIAVKFLNKIQPDKFKLTRFRSNDYITLPVDYITQVYSYSFVRTENNIDCPFNSINVSVSAYTGEIVNFNFYWTELELPSAEKIINLEKAYQSMYANANLELKYIKQYDYNRGLEKSKIKLAYVLSDFNGMIDANTGTIVGSDGKPHKPNPGITTFTDIEGHKAESDINLLIEAGIIQTEATEFKPDDKILQKDFVKLLIKAIEPYYSYPVSNADASTEYNYYYDTAIQRKIISKRERNDDGYVNKQEAAKMIVRALGYGYIAEKSNLFVSPFGDSSYISKSYRGYVVISEELGVFNTVENKFNPKELLTNGNTATAIVNYLKVDTALTE